ncbi:MAG: alpha/beta fold hydrolase [Casimicrobiaceae bacterium]
MTRALAVGATLLLVSGILAGCGDTRSPGGRTLQLGECRLPKVALAAQCGELEVPEDRSKPDGRRISIGVAILAANTLGPAPDPLFLLAGGPGQAASYLGPFAAQFAAVRRHRDIVLVDQRGTGRSSPLTCAAFEDTDAADATLEIDPVPRATRCAQELAARGVDTRQYTTAAWVADLDAVRAALGYARINLWGGSYGTRVAQEYLRRHPQHVRTMVLDGVAPPSLKVALDVWPTREAAIDAAFAACGQSPTCGRDHADLKATLERIDEHLGGGRELTLADPRTGEARTVRIDLDHVIGALQALAYLPEFASLMPHALHEAAAGDFAPLFATAMALTGGLTAELNSALYYSVTCAEDVPRISAAEREAKLTGLRARNLALRGLAVCDVWPHGVALPESAGPVTSEIPVLLLSGGLDPVTPPAYGEEVAKTFGNSRHVVAAGYGHNVSAHACAPRLIAAFIEAGGFATLPRTCIEHLEHSTRPPFWPDRLGPAP